MEHDFFDIEHAFEFVNMQPPETNSAVLSRTTGRIYYISGFGDSDEDIPDDIEDEEAYVWIPHKHDFDLGTPLVHQFIREQAPHLAEDVYGIFSRKGAYSRFKGLLQHKGLLDSWHKYEEKKTEEALREWCQENNIDLKHPTSDDDV